MTAEIKYREFDQDFTIRFDIQNYPKLNFFAKVFAEQGLDSGKAYGLTNSLIRLAAESGSPLVVTQYRNNKIQSVKRYLKGELDDAPNGDAASISYDEKGELSHVFHYSNGEEFNGAQGQPQTQVYESGVLTIAISFNKCACQNSCGNVNDKGVCIKMLSAEQRQEFQSSFRLNTTFNNAANYIKFETANPNLLKDYSAKYPGTIKVLGENKIILVKDEFVKNPEFFVSKILDFGGDDTITLSRYINGKINSKAVYQKNKLQPLEEGGRPQVARYNENGKLVLNSGTHNKH